MITASASILRLSLFATFALAPLAPAWAQEWIWHGDKPGEKDVRFFRKEFRVSDAPEKATLTFACDNAATVYLDGKEIGKNDNWNEPTVIDLTKLLNAAGHVLAVRAENQGSAAGLIARLDAIVASNRKQIVATDASWTVTDKEVAGWNKLDASPSGMVNATSLGKAGVQPWGNVFAAAAGAGRPARTPRAAGPATPAESLTVADGFKVELLRSSQPGEGSWVSMTVDPKGRLIVSPQDKEPMLRFTLGKDGKIATMETIDTTVRSAMGLLYAFDSLYVNGMGPDGYHLYRLRDTDKDDKFDKVELLRKWKGGPGEHGSHGIVLGSDKKLYIVCGNFVDVPDDILATSPHKNYRDDLVLPRMEDGNGFGAGRKPPGGYVVRMDPDGKNTNREILASHYEGQELNSPNDVCVKSDGSIWFSDPWYGRMPVFGVERERELGWQGVFRIAPDGGDPQLVVEKDEYEQPNGLCFSPDESLLYINDTPKAWIKVYDVGPDGTLSNGRMFFEGVGSGVIEEGIPDGMKCDEQGNIWVTGPGGVWVISADGEHLGTVQIPENVGNLTWGGSDWHTLFVPSSSSLYAFTTKVGPHREPYMD